MKWLFTISLLLLSSLIFSQRNKGLLIEENPASLAQYLTAPCSTDRQKVTSIFRWITDNISYKLIPTYQRNVSRRAVEEEEDSSALKPLNERVAETVLKEKMGVCNGYARLFATLCDYAGIRSEIITGYARTNANKPGAKFGANHYWNAVYFDSSWHLLDATWASGYVTRYGTEFVHDYDGQYFLALPQNFIKDHYPDDLRWTLLDVSPIPGEFYNSPFKQKSFIKYRITSYYPQRGIIEASVGDTIRLSLETADALHDKEITPDLLIDSSIFSHSSSWIFLRPEAVEGNPNKLNYSFTVMSPDVEWIYLIYNDDLVLRYKIKLRKDLANN